MRLQGISEPNDPVMPHTQGLHAVLSQEFISSPAIPCRMLRCCSLSRAGVKVYSGAMHLRQAFWGLWCFYFSLSLQLHSTEIQPPCLFGKLWSELLCWRGVQPFLKLFFSSQASQHGFAAHARALRASPGWYLLPCPGAAVKGCVCKKEEANKGPKQGLQQVPKA